MAAKNYVSTAPTGPVADYYGSTLTALQQTQAAHWLEAAETLIDTVATTAWATGAVTDERHLEPGPYLWLRNRPVASVQTVRRRDLLSGTLTTLTVASDYSLEDATRGLLYVPQTCYARPVTLLVSYTPVATVPAPIAAATAALLAEWLASGGPGGAAAGPITRKKVGDVEVAYASSSSTTSSQADALAGLPPRVLQLLAPYLTPMVFA